jgi:hypothetical protein
LPNKTSGNGKCKKEKKVKNVKKRCEICADISLEISAIRCEIK